MKQQVNLLVQSEKARKEFSGLALACVMMTAVIVTLALGSFLLSYYAQSKSAELAEINRVLSQLPSRIAELEAERSTVSASPTLLRQEQVLAGRIDSQRQLAQLVNSFNLSRYQGLSPYLLDMAKATVEGAWLTSIEIDAQSQLASLAGQASQPHNVPVLVERLVSQSAFSKLGVSDFQLRQVGEQHVFELKATLRERAVE